MFKSLFDKLRKNKLKMEFHEYGSVVDTFQLGEDGAIQVAQWQHPFYHPLKLDIGLVNFYRQFIQPGDFTIDIGAHAGDTTIPMALAAGATGTVMALEPNKYVYRVLAENAKLNPGKTHILPLCIAATAEDGVFSFNYSDASFCNGGFLTKREVLDRHHKYTLEIQGKNLDQLLRKDYAQYLPKLSFIKVDAEGYDKEIIKNLSGIIHDYHPFILSECNHYLVKAERDELFDVMSAGGNTLYQIGLDQSRASDFRSVNKQPLKKSDMMKHHHFDILAVPAGRAVHTENKE
jgi:FkbM family methyltransferase